MVTHDQMTCWRQFVLVYVQRYDAISISVMMTHKASVEQKAIGPVYCLCNRIRSDTVSSNNYSFLALLKGGSMQCNLKLILSRCYVLFEALLFL